MQYYVCSLWMVFTLAVGYCIASVQTPNALIDGFRPPAVPLIVFDPYMNIWSTSDHLYDEWPVLWDGTIKALSGIIRIDGSSYRFMGPADLVSEVFPQKNVKVFPTRTEYVFSDNHVMLIVEFITPALAQDLETLSLPITFIQFHIHSVDGMPHAVQIYYDNTGEICVNKVSEFIVWGRENSKINRHQKGGTGIEKHIMKIGTASQPILKSGGDRIGINWGYQYIAVEQNHDQLENVSTVITGSVLARKEFVRSGKIPLQDDTRMPRAAEDDWPVLAVSWDLGIIGSDPLWVVSKRILFAYDDLYSIDWFGTKLQPYWRRNGADAIDLIDWSMRDFGRLHLLCVQFDTELLNRLTDASGPEYATVAALAYRQTFGACKLTWNPQFSLPWYFLKEISSDGDLSTVDVIYPASPLILYQNTQLMKWMLLPLLSYANNETNIFYNLSWAPHHLGYYPIANIKPLDQEQMPIEETANLLILLAAISRSETLYDSIYPHYWPLIRSWAQYLTSVLPDPGNQLCTDDFEGPSPHNVNLAAKGIIGLGAYAYICQNLGLHSEAEKYLAIVENHTRYWITNANDGDHYRLQYDKPNSWSLKYNLLYQSVLSLPVFPSAVIEKEIHYYMSSQLNLYGVPLDLRASFTKLDWLAWVAALSTNQTDFQTLIHCIYLFANETPNRVPLSDWYDTLKATQNGFQARPVVGGLYARMLFPL